MSLYLAGGKAVAAVTSAEDGDGIVKTALDTFGGVHVLVANAGILRDKSFTAMTEAEWDAVIAVHLKGTYKCIKAVWPIFQKQKYGRILTTSSGVGIYGNFGQANYSTAKGAIIGLTRTAAIEGSRYNILANALAPSAGTAMTQTVWPQEMVDAFKPDYVAPVVGYLVSEANQNTTGSLFEVSGGWAAQTRWQRSYGVAFPHKKELTPEMIIAKWDGITKFGSWIASAFKIHSISANAPPLDGRATYPTSTQEALQQIIGNFSSSNDEEEGDNLYADAEDSEATTKAKLVKEAGEYSYTERDIILYNLGIGATEQELQWVFENDDHFGPLPSFGVIPQFATNASLPFDFLPNFNPVSLIPCYNDIKVEILILRYTHSGQAPAR